MGFWHDFSSLGDEWSWIRQTHFPIIGVLSVGMRLTDWGEGSMISGMGKTAKWMLMGLLVVVGLIAGVILVKWMCSPYNFTTNNGTITITKYKGVGGAVEIPSKINGLPVTSIGEAAFWNCISLTSVTIPNSVTSIGDLAFMYCPLTKVTIPNSVTNIGVEAFFGCQKLTNVSISKSVTNIMAPVFWECPNLTGITVDANNPSYSSVDGVLFNKSQTILVKCPEGRAGTYTIPTSVTDIGENAFLSCTRLTNVTIPSSVTNIGGGAFSGCNLTNITIPASVVNIGGGAFQECKHLTSVTIPTSVTSIGDVAFWNCANLTNITIPESVTNIGKRAFNDCPKLTSISVNAFNSAYSSQDGILFNKDKTMLIQYPMAGKTGNYSIPDGVTSIGQMAFESCVNLTSVTIPTNVTSIGQGAFYVCHNLTNVTFSANVTNIEATTFYMCGELTRITIPASVTTIGDGAFQDCFCLSGVYFQGDAPNLGRFVFAGGRGGLRTTIYYLPTTTGWGKTFGGRPTAVWKQ